MSNANPKKLLRKLLLKKSNNNRLWVSLLALCVGTTLLLLSVMIWWNFQGLLNGKNGDDSLGSTFLTIGKTVTDQNMSKPNETLFKYSEIEAIKSYPKIKDVGILTSNRFPVYMSLTSSMGFSTELFLEAAPDRFIDNKPVDWAWQSGTRRVPIILSSEFLNLYNYGFALSQGLPQLSEKSIQSLAFNLQVGYGEDRELYTANVVGFSDRITSVLVPQSFLAYANKKYAPKVVALPSRLILKVDDPSNKDFIQFLADRNYTTNSEMLRWQKLRSVVEAISSATGLLAILLMGMGTLVFILFIELTIAKAQQSLTLLLTLGYSPKYLSLFMVRRFVPLLLGAVLVSGLLAAAAQSMAADVLLRKMNLTIDSFPGWPVWAALAISITILMLLVSRAVMLSIKK